MRRNCSECQAAAAECDGRFQVTTLFTSATPGTQRPVRWEPAVYPIVEESADRTGGERHLALSNGKGDRALLCLVASRQQKEREAS